MRRHVWLVLAAYGALAQLVVAGLLEGTPATLDDESVGAVSDHALDAEDGTESLTGSGLVPLASPHWVDRQLSRIDPHGLSPEAWLRLQSGDPATPSADGGVDGLLRSDWFFPRSRWPQVYLSVRWSPETGVLDLRGVRLRMRREGLGVHIERGDEDRDSRFGIDYRRAF